MKGMQRFRSFEEYAASLGHTDLRLIALAPDRATWASHRVELDGVSVRRARDGGPCLYDVAISADGIGLLVGVNAAGKVTGNGTVFGPHSVMLIPGRTEVRSTSLDAVEWISAFIPASRLNGLCDHNGVRRLVPASVIDGGTVVGIRLHRLLKRVVHAAMMGAFEGNPIARSDAAEELSVTVHRLVASPPPGEVTRARGRPARSKGEIMASVHEWLEEHRGPEPRLRDLVRVAGVSARTLHTAFQEQAGVSPKRFVRLRLLNAVRRELRRAARDGDRVTDVFTRYGIWNWGRLSGEYRELFGEYPSDTVRARQRRFLCIAGAELSR